MMECAPNPIFELRQAESDLHILWVGSTLPKMRDQSDKSSLAFAFDQVDDLSGITSDTPNLSDYDCVIINFESDDHSQYLRFAMIVANRSLRKVFALAPAEKVDFLTALPGVDCIFEKPASASSIVEELNQAFADGKESLDGQQVNHTAEIQTPLHSENEAGSTNSVSTSELGDAGKQGSAESKGKAGITEGFETSVSLAQEIDRSIWRKFLPVVNFLYKKLAILALGSLFLTFLAYGAMIIFYLSSSSWTLPFELSKGHKIVQKVERDLSQLRVSRNLFRQQLTINATELSSAARKSRHGQLQIDAIEKTINEEVNSKQREQEVLKTQIGRLVAVEKEIESARSESDLPNYFSSLKKLLKNKVVSRRAVESVRLSLIEAELRLATMRNEIADKRQSLALSVRQERQLRALQVKISDPEFTYAPTMDTQFSYMIADLMAARTSALAAKSELSAAKQRQVQISDSLQVVTRNIDNVTKTPMARAIEKSVAVLFIPYQNSEAVKPNQDLYSCSFYIFVCKVVGTVGDRVDGETVASHPLFNKPMRGYFVEARFENPLSVTEELLHIGRAPMLF